MFIFSVVYNIIGCSCSYIYASKTSSKESSFKSQDVLNRRLNPSVIIKPIEKGNNLQEVTETFDGHFTILIGRSLQKRVLLRKTINFILNYLIHSHSFF